MSPKRSSPLARFVDAGAEAVGEAERLARDLHTILHGDFEESTLEDASAALRYFEREFPGLLAREEGGLFPALREILPAEAPTLKKLEEEHETLRRDWEALRRQAAPVLKGDGAVVSRLLPGAAAAARSWATRLASHAAGEQSFLSGLEAALSSEDLARALASREPR